MLEQGLVERPNKRYEELLSAKSVSAEEHAKVVLELKELGSRHQEELTKIQERHVAELQKLRDAKSKLDKEQKGKFFILLTLSSSFVAFEVVV